MTHLTDKEIAKRFLAGDTVLRIAKDIQSSYVVRYENVLEVEAAIRRVMRGLAYGSEVRRVMLKQEKKRK